MKRKDEKLTAVVAPVLVMSMALTACSGSGDKEKASTTPKAVKRRRKASGEASAFNRVSRDSIYGLC